MKRIYIAIIFLFLMLTPIYCAEAYFATYDAAYNIDLSDPMKQYTGAGDNIDAAHGVTYTDTSMIAYVGVSGTTEPVKVEISKWYTTPWMYQSASQPNLRRPFGIDFVLRNRWYYYDGGSWPFYIETIRQHDITGEIPSHYGYQDRNTQMDVNFTFDLSTDRSVTRSGHELGFSILDPGNYYYDYTLITSFVDIVLVLPEIDPFDTSYQIGSADDYYASFDIHVNGSGIDETYHCEINGYYDTDKPESMQITLNVVPNANSSSINLDETSGVIAPGSGEGLPIATYSYTTTQEASDNSVRYYAFVSSSEYPNIPGEEFTLRKSGSADSDNENNSIKYQIRIQSGQSGRNGSSSSGWFDGTLSIKGIDEGNMSGVFFDSVYMEMQRPGNSPTYLNYDSGNILFRLADGTNPGLLDAGVYESYIYFHVITQQ